MSYLLLLKSYAGLKKSSLHGLLHPLTLSKNKDIMVQNVSIKKNKTIVAVKRSFVCVCDTRRTSNILLLFLRTNIATV